jgi:phospholipase C
MAAVIVRFNATLLLLLLLIYPSCPAAVSASIRHIVLLIEENRSFDHIFGFRKGVNGLTGNESNPVDPMNASYGRVYVSAGAPDVALCDPDHDLPPTTWKIYGPEAARSGNLSVPTMDGFVSFEFLQRNETNTSSRFCGVMESLSPSRTPVLHALADAFVLMDAFHASVPGPTWPNRMFALSGTSAGQTETDNPWFQGVLGHLFPQETIFDQLEASGLSWRNYVGDGPWELFMESIARRPNNVLEMSHFYSDARLGSLPNLSYISPRAGMSFEAGACANDMHPDHSVAEGEQLIKDIYEALVTSPQWNETLLIITFDEHGGFYDHVPPPTGVPPPDTYPSFPDSFGFDRLGIRIPTLLISPWVPRNVVEGKPSVQAKPQPNSEYELSSIPSTIRQLFRDAMAHTPPLTRRDAWAATFGHVLSETEPRVADVPRTLPDPAPSPHYQIGDHLTSKLAAEAAKPMNGLQRHISSVLAHLSGVAPFRDTTQRNMSDWIRGAVTRWQTLHSTNSSTSQAKCLPYGINTKRDETLTVPSQMFRVRCQSYLETSYVSGVWTIHNASTGLKSSFHSQQRNKGEMLFPIPLVALSTSVNDSVLCMVPSATSIPTNASVAVVPCSGFLNASRCFDGGEGNCMFMWRLRLDASIELFLWPVGGGPAVASGLCVSSGCPSNALTSSSVVLSPCVQRIGQRWSVFPANPDDNFSDKVYLSEGGVWAVVVVADAD